MSIRGNYSLPDSPTRGFSSYVRKTIRHCRRQPTSLLIVHPEGEGALGTASPEDNEEGTRRENWVGTLNTNSRDLSVKEAAEHVGIAWRRFYDLITRRVIPAKHMGGTLTLQPGWEAAARQWRTDVEAGKEKAQVNTFFAHAWKRKRGITFASAETQIKRWRLSKLDNQEIVEKIGREWIEKARHSSDNK